MARVDKNTNSSTVVSSFGSNVPAAQPKTAPQQTKVVTLKNTLRNPLTISYGGEAIRLSPGQSAQGLNRDKLGSLPKGVVVLA